MTQRLASRAQALLKRNAEAASFGARASRFAALAKAQLLARRYSLGLLLVLLLAFVLKSRPGLWKKFVQLII